MLPHQSSMKKETQAVFKYVRISPLKLRRIVNLVRGKGCSDAMALLESLPNKGARIVEKIVKSAVSNAVQNHQMVKESLEITEIKVDSAGMLKRFRAQARGRAGSIKKRISHLSIKVGEK